MVSAAFAKLRSPVAKSCLVALAIATVIDAALTIFAAFQYPFLIPDTNELRLPSSITLIYSAIGTAAILLSISTAVASYKSSTNFVLVHACITGVFLPLAILAYFSSLSSRYKVGDYADDYKQMIQDYRVPAGAQFHKSDKQPPSDISTPINTTPNSSADQTTPHRPTTKLISFINLIDLIQNKFSCCGLEGTQDWVHMWDGYVPISCCSRSEEIHSESRAWANLFNLKEDHEFHHCPEQKAHHLGCLVALKEDEKSKFAWLSNLIVFLMVMTITNTVLTLLLYGLSKTEDMPYETNDHELAMVGVSTKPRPSQPEITGIRHRPSVVPSKEQIAVISHAVRFNLANSSPRGSISGPSKFSAAARRGSAHV